MLIQDMSKLATGRSLSLFLADVEARKSEISRVLLDKRVLVIGGAGSIGSSFIRQLSTFDPQVVHIVDQSENNLAELVRDLRSSPGGLSIPDFRTLPLDFGSSTMERFLRAQEPYDFVVNFAAIKHVRSEKDVFSLLQMIDTNVVKTARLLQWLGERGGTSSFFSVSTDKAANPVNLMGASKRLMEHVMFSGDIIPDGSFNISSARFANVAFSDGSLLQSFLKRWEKRQPSAVPRSTRRFFVSLDEAGQICLLAAFCAPHKHLLIPKLDSDVDLCDLETIARSVLKKLGYEPHIYEDEAEARASILDDLSHGRYPLLVTPLDTSGEKPYEEFVGEGEVAQDVGMQQLLGIPYKSAPAGTVAEFVQRVEAIINEARICVTKGDLIREMTSVVSELRHLETGTCLDQRM